MEAALLLQKEIGELCPLRDAKKLADKWDELDQLMKRAQRSYQQARMIHTSTRATIARNIGKYRRCISVLDRPDASLADLSDAKISAREIAPGVPIQAMEVTSIDMIPDTPIYYAADTGEWGIRVMGRLITGQVGEIRRHGKKHIRCRIRTPHDKAVCPMWHHGEPIGWLQSQWIHTDQPPNASNRLMRHAGSRSTLQHDIQRLPPGEVSIRRRQLAHDLLVYLACLET